MSRRLVVIGGGAAGMAAAARARRVDPGARITVVEKAELVSLGVCGLPYLISGEVARPEDLVVVPRRELIEKHRLELLTRHLAEAVESGKRTVQVRDLERGRSLKLPYDRLVVAPGACCAAPGLPGALAPNVFALRHLGDALGLMDYLRRHRPRRAVVLGGGYLGLEMAESFHRLGLAVSVLEARDGLLGLLPELSRELRAELEGAGVEVRCGRRVTHLEGGRTGPVSTAVDHTGEHHPGDLFLLGLGATPGCGLLAAAGARLGATGAVSVDRRGETSLSGVYAAGDCVEVEQVVGGRRGYHPLATTAARLGRVAGENAAGGHRRFQGTLGTVAIRLLGLEAARTGLDPDQAGQCGLDVQTVQIDAATRPGYMPQPGRLRLVVVATSSDRRVLGAQAVGTRGALERVNLMAAAVAAGLRTTDLADLDLGYTPTLAPLRDPVRLAGRQAVRQTEDLQSERGSLSPWR